MTDNMAKRIAGMAIHLWDLGPDTDTLLSSYHVASDMRDTEVLTREQRDAIVFFKSK